MFSLCQMESRRARFFLAAGSFFIRFGLPRLSRNCFQKILNGVCADLSAGTAKDVIETVRCPRQQKVQVGNSNLVQALGEAGALVKRNQFITAAMEQQSWWRIRCD